jgi:putative DNA primase/helicase
MKSRSETNEDIYQAARAYVKSGLSLIPIRPDGTKMPAFDRLPAVWSEEDQRYKRPWGPYRARRPSRGELRDWFARADEGQGCGMAILGGEVSGGLEIIDCDNWEAAERWMKLVGKQSPALIDKLVCVRSPRPGLHAYYRCPVFGGNQKLALAPDPEKDNKKPKGVVEIKGEGGYCLAPPSPASCHPSGKRYTFIGGKDLTRVPTISPREREVLLDCARRINTWVEPERPRPPAGRAAAADGMRPGDDFNRRADWAEVLEPHGWRWVRRSCGEDYWRRPGKEKGTSATTNFAGSDLLYVFSSNAYPFEEGTAYTKFHAYAILEHGGDFHAAARALAGLGYGAGVPGTRRVNSAFARYAEFVRRLGC